MKPKFEKGMGVGHAAAQVAKSSPKIAATAIVGGVGFAGGFVCGFVSAFLPKKKEKSQEGQQEVPTQASVPEVVTA